MKKIELQNVKGSNDYGSKEQIIRNFISDTLRKTFEKYGYKPLATSLLCYYDLLALKYDKDNDILKEIYKVKDQADRNLALRYDLTVPFAKYIALNQSIPMPFKRYEIGEVFRDGPVKYGRLREFIQCDVDCVGIEGQMVEAELIALYVEGFKNLGINIKIKYNNRKIMSGIIESCNIPKEKVSDTITIIDKFDKLSRQQIRQEFIKIGLEEEMIDRLIKYLDLSFEKIQKEFDNSENELLKCGIEEIKELNKYINSLNLNNYVEFSSTLARGQEYYTGTVFEVYQVDGKITSSIGGGGRYDNMIGDFIGNGQKYPAVGISFGLDVIFEILKENESFKASNTLIYIIPMENKTLGLEIANSLRNKNINVDIEMNDKKMKKALNYANSEKIPYVIIIGEEELKHNKVILKNMETGEQEEIEVESIESKIK